MALGLSVIFGVVRVVNFAHGEMMTMAMYAVITVFAALHLDPLVLLVPVALAMFAFGYLVQASIINPFITRPEHSQFLLLVAMATIIVNVLLIVFGPDAQNVQVSYAFDSYQIGKIIVDATKLYAGIAANTFPKPVKVGTRSLWVEAEIDQWIADRIAERDVGENVGRPKAA